MKQKINTGVGYAWEFEGMLCGWAEPDLARLKDGGKPTPEAKAIKVRIIRESDYRKLIVSNNKLSR